MGQAGYDQVAIAELLRELYRGFKRGGQEFVEHT